MRVLRGPLALTDDAAVHHLACAAYDPSAGSDAHYDGPVLGPDLPHPAVAVSDKDTSWPDMAP